MQTKSQPGLAALSFYWTVTAMARRPIWSTVNYSDSRPQDFNGATNWNALKTSRRLTGKKLFLAPGFRRHPELLS
jgi:hypothetical protein